MATQNYPNKKPSNYSRSLLKRSDSDEKTVRASLRARAPQDDKILCSIDEEVDDRRRLEFSPARAREADQELQSARARTSLIAARESVANCAPG